MGRFIGVLSRLGKWFLCPPWLIVTGSSANRMFRLVCIRALIVLVTAGKAAGVWWAEKNYFGSTIENFQISPSAGILCICSLECLKEDFVLLMKVNGFQINTRPHKKKKKAERLHRRKCLGRNECEKIPTDLFIFFLLKINKSFRYP